MPLQENESEPAPGRRRVVLLLGAGASVPAKIPHTRALIECVKNECPDGLEPALHAVLGLLERWSEQRSEPLDIERLYETVIRLSEPLADPILAEALREDLGVSMISAEDAGDLRDFMEQTIRTKMYAQIADLDYLAPLRSLVQSDGALEVFSTNYDTCIELLCEHLRLTWADGFSIRWDPSTFDAPNVQVKLRKLHGSVLWYENQAGHPFRSLLGGSRTAMHLTEWFGGICRPFLLYPARKSGYDAPYVENLAAFADALGKRDRLTVLVVIGYSFRDEAITKVVFDAARRNQELVVLLIDPDAERIYVERLQSMPRAPDVPSPLRDRVVPYGVGLDANGTLTRRLVTSLIDAATSARSDELMLIGGDVQASFGWWQAAVKHIDGGDLRGYWRCIERGSKHALGSSRVEAISRMTEEVRLAVMFGVSVRPQGRIEWIEEVFSHWLGELRIEADGDRLVLKFLNFNGSVPSADEVANPLRACADRCLLELSGLPAKSARSESTQALDGILRRFADAISICDGAQRGYASVDELRERLVKLGASSILKREMDSRRAASVASMWLRQEQDKTVAGLRLLIAG